MARLIWFTAGIIAGICFVSIANAAEVTLPINAKMIQCGTIEQAIEKCVSEEEMKCCGFMDSIEPAGDEVAPEIVVQEMYEVIGDELYVNEVFE